MCRLSCTSQKMSLKNRRKGEVYSFSMFTECSEEGRGELFMRGHVLTFRAGEICRDEEIHLLEMGQTRSAQKR